MARQRIIVDVKKLSAQCKWLDQEVSAMVAGDLLDTARAHKNCLGLAAPQIGFNACVFVMSDHGELITVINPIIIKMSGTKDYKHEACLSRPGASVKVQRSIKIRATYRDQHGTKYERNFTGINARIFQHEFDHLNGILI